MTKFEQIVSKTITSLSKAELKGLEIIRRYAFQDCVSLTNISFPDTLKEIRDYCFDGCTSLKTITIPKNVNFLGKACFQDCTLKVRFEQPLGMAVALPTAGSTGVGMFYSKTAREMIIYTDNEIIKNYKWASDNVTPTLCHLDGTLWE